MKWFRTAGIENHGLRAKLTRSPLQQNMAKKPAAQAEKKKTVVRRGKAMP